MFYMYFMMFYYVLWCLASRATIGDRLSDHDTAAGIGDNSAEIDNGAAENVDIAAKVIPC